MTNEEYEAVKRLKWACRRGMLELDVLLAPFVEQHYLQLSAEQKSAFERLLSEDDPDLFAWFMGHEICPQPELAQIVALILQHNQPCA